MRDELLHYYERELTFLRRMGAEFAEQYPKVAARLSSSRTSARIRTSSGCSRGSPSSPRACTSRSTTISPRSPKRCSTSSIRTTSGRIPSMSMVEFELDPGAGQADDRATGCRATSMLYSRPVDGVPCKFQHAATTRRSGR